MTCIWNHRLQNGLLCSELKIWGFVEHRQWIIILSISHEVGEFLSPYQPLVQRDRPVQSNGISQVINPDVANSHTSVGQWSAILTLDWFLGTRPIALWYLIANVWIELCIFKLPVLFRFARCEQYTCLLWKSYANWNNVTTIVRKHHAQWDKTRLL